MICTRFSSCFIQPSQFCVWTTVIMLNKYLLCLLNSLHLFMAISFLVYNIHGRIHLANDVRKFGAPDNFSGFPFENFLGKMKRLPSKPHRPLQQVIRRVSEKQFSCQSKHLKQLVHSSNICKQEHFSGPLPPDFSPMLSISLTELERICDFCWEG